MIREYMFDLSKALEGALKGDHAKAVAYAEQLAVRLERNGEADAASRVRQALNDNGSKKGAQAQLARAGSAPNRALPGNSNGKRDLEAELADAISDNGLNSAGALPFDADFSLPMAQVQTMDNLEGEVVLQSDAQKVVTQFVRYVSEAPQLNQWGVGVAATLLLWGPPGCGKTRTAAHIASQLGLPLVTARVDAIVSSYLGSTAKNLRQLFDYAASFPCVLFLDELDALGKMRDDAHELGELKRVVISLLQNIDVLAPGQIVLAATNHPHLLDLALWRRFAYKVELREPDLTQRTQMLDKFLDGWADEAMISLLGALTEGMNGALLKFLADECIRDAILNYQGAAFQKQITLDSVRRAWRAVAFSPFVNGGTGQNETQAFEQKWEELLLDFSLLLPHLRRVDPKIWTQAQLAQMSGLSQSQVSRILAGDKAQTGKAGAKAELASDGSAEANQN